MLKQNLYLSLESISSNRHKFSKRLPYKDSSMYLKIHLTNLTIPKMEAEALIEVSILHAYSAASSQ